MVASGFISLVLAARRDAKQYSLSYQVRFVEKGGGG